MYPVLRLATGIGSPLEKLQKVYHVLVELQGQAMAVAPTRPGCNIPTQV